MNVFSFNWYQQINTSITRDKSGLKRSRKFSGSTGIGGRLLFLKKAFQPWWVYFHFLQTWNSEKAIRGLIVKHTFFSKPSFGSFSKIALVPAIPSAPLEEISSVSKKERSSSGNLNLHKSSSLNLSSKLIGLHTYRLLVKKKRHRVN